MLRPSNRPINTPGSGRPDLLQSMGAVNSSYPRTGIGLTMG